MALPPHSFLTEFNASSVSFLALTSVYNDFIHLFTCFSCLTLPSECKFHKGSDHVHSFCLVFVERIITLYVGDTFLSEQFGASLTGWMTTQGCSNSGAGALSCSSLCSQFLAQYLVYISSMNLKWTCSLINCCEPGGQSIRLPRVSTLGPVHQVSGSKGKSWWRLGMPLSCEEPLWTERGAKRMSTVVWSKPKKQNTCTRVVGG